jgi:hypothetical protein
MYTAVMNGVAITAAAEIFFVEAPTDSAIILHEFKLTQDAFTTSEQLALKVYRTATDQGAKGTAITPTPLNVGDVAAGQTVQSAILSAATFATPGVMLLRDAQNVLNGFHWLPTPEARIVISPGGYVVFKLETAPSVSMTFSGYITFEEIGG